MNILYYTIISSVNAIIIIIIIINTFLCTTYDIIFSICILWYKSIDRIDLTPAGFFTDSHTLD